MKKEENKVSYGRIGEKEDLQLIGIVDASYKSDEVSRRDVDVVSR